MLLQNITIIGASSKQNGKTLDIWIENGKLAKIAKTITPKSLKIASKTKIFDATGWYICASFVDVGTHTADPGMEQKDDLHSIAKAAAAGGFGILLCAPNTLPSTNSKSEIAYMRSKTREESIEFLPIAAITNDTEGKKLNEMYDLRQAGAVAFSDGKHPMQNASVLLRALEYVKPFNGLVLNQPHDNSIIGSKGQMHEGYYSTLLGMKGAPALAETLMLQRDIALREYSESRLLAHCISSAESTKLLAAAKQTTDSLYASVAVANLVFEDANLIDFDSHYKMFPHLRTADDRSALLAALKDKTIDIICSNHTPHEDDCKNLEFQYASYGIIALETTFAMLATYTDLAPDAIVRTLSDNPRRIFALPQPTFEVGETADYTLFNPDITWDVNDKTLHSKSQNTPLLHKTVRGQAITLATFKTPTDK
jgi:dihydroorotase